jgi:hypothetical protein
MVKYYFAGIQRMLWFADDFLGPAKTQGSNAR